MHHIAPHCTTCNCWWQHYNAPHATDPPCMWGPMQILHGRNGVTDVRVGSPTATATSATAALFTYRSQEGRGRRGRGGRRQNWNRLPCLFLSLQASLPFVQTTFRDFPCMCCSSCFKYSWLSIYLQLDEQLRAVGDGHLLAHPHHQARVGPVLVRGHAQHCRQHHRQTHKLFHFDYWSPSCAFDVSLFVSTLQKDRHTLAIISNQPQPIQRGRQCSCSREEPNVTCCQCEGWGTTDGSMGGGRTHRAKATTCLTTTAAATAGGKMGGD